MPKLVNLGSLCVDHVFHVPQISSAGETVASTAYEIHPGGKGLNQSLAAAKAGIEVLHAGCVGKDGTMLVETLLNGGVNVDHIASLTDSASGSAFIQVDPLGQNAIAITGGSNRRISESMVRATLDLVADDDWLLLQNEINDLELVLSIARAKGIKVAFNVAPVDGREQNYALDAIALLIVNEIEAMALARTGDYRQALEELTDRYVNTEVVLTLGRDGLLFAHGKETIELEAFDVDAVDETAAGDAFIGYLMASLLQGNSQREALRKASAAGALAVTRMGAATSIPTQDEVESFLSRQVRTS